MASGLIVSGRGDLDALFAPRSGAARANVGFRVAGTDIANRYEQIGGGTPIAATGFRAAGTDLASLFLGQTVTTHTLVAGTYVGSNTWIGYVPAGSAGSLTPATFAGAAINLMADLTTGAPAGTGFYVEIAGSRARAFFSSITINGHTYLTSSAVHGDFGTYTQWAWMSGALAGLVNAASYPVSMS